MERPKERLLQNRYPRIFKDDLAFTMFVKMHEIYKDDRTHHLAKYSFLFYAMKKDEFIISSQIKYIEFLGDYEISICKVDSRQSGLTNKTDLYNSIKEALPKDM